MLKLREHQFNQIKIKQDGDDITLCTILKPETCMAGTTYGNICASADGACIAGTTYKGSYIDDKSFSLTAQFTPPRPEWAHDTGHIDDPDHLSFGKTGKGGTIYRAAPRPDDVPCDADNTFHTTVEYAFTRARSAINDLKDYKKAVCWLCVGAGQQHARSQSMLAYVLAEAPGVKRDYPMAFGWAQKAADQNDWFGEIMLARMYHFGRGTRPDPEKVKVWLVKGQAGLKAELQRPTAGSVWEQMSDAQRQYVIRATMAVFGTIAGTSAETDEVRKMMQAHPGMSEDNAREFLRENDPTYRDAQETSNQGFDTMLNMILGLDKPPK